MVQASDDTTKTDDDVVVPLRPEQSGPKDPTGAERQARFRESLKRNGKGKRKKSNRKRGDGARTVTLALAPVDAPPITPTVTPSDGVESVTLHARPASLVLAPNEEARASAQRHGRGIRFVALIAALGLATVSGGFSIVGLTSIFTGAFGPVIGMGFALEVGKLSAVAALPTLRWGPLKGALTMLVLVLMGFNAIGCYGFLAKAHIGHLVEGETAIGARLADVEARLGVQAEKVADLTKQIAELDAARTIETPATGNLRTASAINAHAAALAAAAKLRTADDERRQAKRMSLADKLTVEAKALADLKIEKAKIDGERRTAEADLGPVRYLAALIGAGDQGVLRWFILVVAVVLDPAAVLLLPSGRHPRR
jgi:hypothetical protein